ncbi:MAG: hypothetical protein HN945_07810 [Deltaproteobacteria bacterium]|nr:hypothetical protein [Deltaproteobacteria bacterium]
MENLNGSMIKPGLKKRLIWAFMIVTFVITVLFSVFLPYRFYKRDVEAARVKSMELSEIIREGLLSTMIATGKPETIRKLIKKYQTKTQFKFRLIRSPVVEKQHGTKEDDQETDGVIRQVLETGKRKEDWISNTRFRYVSPYLADERCQQCHEKTDQSKIEPGTVLGASEIIFDLKEQRYRSIRFILEITVMIIVCMIILGVYLFLIVKWNVLDPLLLE